MRPPHFCGGNIQNEDARPSVEDPSMRPPHFCGGNVEAGRPERVLQVGPSMRPPHFCGGNKGASFVAGQSSGAFNEAPAFLRGKRGKLRKDVEDYLHLQ